MRTGNPAERKRVVVLGATGSIGESALKVARDIPERMEIVGLAANSNAEKLAAAANETRAPAVCLVDDTKIDALLLANVGSLVSSQSGGGHLYFLPEWMPLAAPTMVRRFKCGHLGRYRQPLCSTSRRSRLAPGRRRAKRRASRRRPGALKGHSKCRVASGNRFPRGSHGSGRADLGIELRRMRL